MKSNALQAIVENAEFYKSNFRLMIKIVFLSLLLNMILFLSLWYNQTSVKTYFLTVTDQGIVKEFSLPEKPMLTEEMLMNWISLNIPKLYKVDFLNYREQILALEPLFTEYGWQEFNKVFKETMTQIRQGKMVAKSTLNGVPVLTAEGFIAGVKSWKVQVPILVTFSKGNEQGTSNFILNLTIQENTDITELAKGQYFGISQIIQLNR